ncbi:hypothetical protein [Clostridium thermarum]|uniref:hypothetical protein n=1 Tax=Clostridium thermarum TaxID=1716543 RepID=UPI0013D5889D|nr:hypothetical protein [Clostridium thermarum]
MLNDTATAKAAIVVIGEKSYTHGTEWANKEPTIPADQVAVIDKFYNPGIPVIAVVVMPRSVDQIGTDVTANQLEKWDLPYDLGATEAERAEIRNYINNNKPVPTNYGNPLFPYGYGLQSFN